MAAPQPEFQGQGSQRQCSTAVPCSGGPPAGWQLLGDALGLFVQVRSLGSSSQRAGAPGGSHLGLTMLGLAK